MRTQQLALAAALTAAVFSANAAQNRMEPVNSPFTWEALGATPTITFGRAAKAVEAPKAAVAPQATETPKAGAAPAAREVATTRTAGSNVSPFTYDALGATPHIELKKQPKSEVQAPATAAH